MGCSALLWSNTMSCSTPLEQQLLALYLSSGIVIHGGRGIQVRDGLAGWEVTAVHGHFEHKRFVQRLASRGHQALSQWFSHAWPRLDFHQPRTVALGFDAATPISAVEQHRIVDLATSLLSFADYQAKAWVNVRHGSGTIPLQPSISMPAQPLRVIAPLKGR